MDSIFLPPDEETVAQQKRVQRNAVLKETVDTMNPMRWETMTEEKRKEWREYRQALLDIPVQSGFPHEIEWPEKPLF